jgi:hypothetical protein
MSCLVHPPPRVRNTATLTLTSNYINTLNNKSPNTFLAYPDTVGGGQKSPYQNTQSQPPKTGNFCFHTYPSILNPNTTPRIIDLALYKSDRYNQGIVIVECISISVSSRKKRI